MLCLVLILLGKGCNNEEGDGVTVNLISIFYSKTFERGAVAELQLPIVKSASEIWTNLMH